MVSNWNRLSCVVIVIVIVALIPAAPAGAYAQKGSSGGEVQPIGRGNSSGGDQETFTRDIPDVSEQLAINPSGVTWNWLSPTPQVDFLNQDTGYVCGSNGGIFKTTTGGVTWSQLPVAFFNNFNAISAANDDSVWAGGSGGAIFISTNGGNSWTQQSTPDTEEVSAM